MATLDRVIFTNPQNGTLMLAMERKATVVGAERNKVHLRAQLFGGGVHILDLNSLQAIIGPVQFDSDRSRMEQDFRILIRPSDWESVKRFCFEHLDNPNDTHLESVPHRELFEEFGDALNIHLQPDQYTVQPTGFVVENDPTPTDNPYARGQPTVRLYRIFDVCIIDDTLCTGMLAASQHDSDRAVELRALEDFQSGGKGRANSILALPLQLVTQSYLAIPPELRYRAIRIQNHVLDESVLAVLEGIEVPQYQRF